MKALIDGDILLYRVGFGAEAEEGSIAINRMDELIHRIITTTNSDSHQIYLSDGRDSTFRYRLNNNYKGNRKQPKPLHYQLLKEYLIEQRNAIVAVDEEADDLMGIEQSKYIKEFLQANYLEHWETIICSIDKDLLQIPGNHYNFVKDEFITITEDEGIHFFYLQLLMGDKADNIPGITGIGVAKATNILESYLGDTEEVIFKIVQNSYRNWLQDFWADQGDWTELQEQYMNDMILLNGQMLKIRTYKDELWQLPTNLGQKVAEKVSSPPSLEEGTDAGLPSMNA